MVQLPGTQLQCASDERKLEIAADPATCGIDYIEVADPYVQTTLDVHFIKKRDPANEVTQQNVLKDIALNPASVTIQGGVRVKQIRITGIQHVAGSDMLNVSVDSYGDFSLYTLAIGHAQMDPIYKVCAFSFKAGCPSRFDCAPDLLCLPEPEAEPRVDYMAKDFSSFRQALVDLIPTLVPNWKERHDADLGMALVDLLSYSADHLSYYQDAVANEAYLMTARHRISVHRHARLIDYHMHDGVSARAFCFFEMAQNQDGSLAAGTQLLTKIETPLRNETIPLPVIPEELKDDALRAAEAVFETMADAHLSAALNELATHTWGASVCCLPRGATAVDVEYQGDLTGLLKVGDFVLLEDANPAHRQVVRLASVGGEHTDEFDLTKGVTTLTWDQADALTFPLDVGPGAGVVRGNMVLCDHGQTVTDWHPADPADLGPGIQSRPRYRFFLPDGPLSQRILDGGGPVGLMALVDPGTAVPQVTCQTEPPSARQAWSWVPDLLDATAFENRFAVEIENDGRPQIRFGDDEFGLSPPDGSFILATYRIGVGAAGNVGRDSISHMICAHGVACPDITAITNPLPAWGGMEPEEIERVKLVAPAAFHATQLRAVTEPDYATVAELHPQVFKANARFEWTGSWFTVLITIQPVGSLELTEALKESIRDFVVGYTQVGYDLEIREPIYVPLELDLNLCVDSDHFRADVEKAVLAVLGNGLVGAAKAFFNHDNWPMGKSLFISDLLSAVQGVEGVAEVDIKTLKRLDRASATDPTSGYLDSGLLKIGSLEVVRLDNDPNFPENGSLRLVSAGGK